MTLSQSQKIFLRIGFLVVLIGLLYTQYLRPTPLSLDTVIPNTPQLGETHISFMLENDTLLIPTQCLQAKWDMSNTRGIYLNDAGVAAPESQTLCNLPAPNGVFTRLRVELPDDTAITYDFKVRVLLYDPIFLVIFLLIMGIIISFLVVEIKKLNTLWQIFGGMSVVGIIILIGGILITSARFLDDKPTVWDDALMFARYSHNLNETGTWSWNMGESPVFGMTELVYGALVYAYDISGATTNPVTLVQNTSTQYGVLWAFLGVILLGIAIFTPDNRKNIPRSLVVIFLLLLGITAHPNLLHHFTSGMGTTTVLLYVTGYIALAHWAKNTPKTWIYVIVGIIGGFGFAIRPDVMLFTACVPLAFFILAKTDKNRRLALFMGIATLIILGIQLLLARLYFGSALPLPFFAKSGGIADGYLANQYVAVGIDQLATYLYSNRYLIGLIVAGLIGNHKAFIKRIGVVEMGLIVGMMGYIGYYALFVTQIMPEYQRFYYPTLPIVIWLAYLGALSLTERIWNMLQLPLVWRFISGNVRLGLIFGVVIISIITLSKTLYEAYRFLYQHEATYYPPHDARWYKLAQFANVDTITVATTEVGAVAVANTSWRVIDLAGLNDTRFALEGFSTDVLLDEYRPDLLYLPYPDYIEMIEAIVTHPSFIRDYTYFTAGQIRLPMGVAIRNDSPQYDELMGIIQSP